MSFYQTLVEHSMVGIVIVQADNVIYRNSEHKRMFRHFPKRISSELECFIHPKDYEAFRTLYHQIASGKVQQLHLVFRCYPKLETENPVQMKWIHCRGNRIDYDGRDAVLFNMQDITQMKALEHMVRVEDKMALLGKLSAGIAHEIRNPLGGVNMYVEALCTLLNESENLDARDTEEARQIVEKIQAVSDKIKNVVRRVMAFAGPSTPEFKRISLNAPVEAALNMCEVTLRKSDVEVEKILMKKLPECRCDKLLIEQVIINIITNAVQALKDTTGPKQIVVETGVDGEWVFARFSDSGPGVARHLKKKIFDPFLTTKAEGIGIGLTISHRIITDHNGSIEVGTGKSGGAEFTIRLPYALN